MPFEIRKPATVPYLRALLMGQPKVGKTTFIGTSPVRTLVLDFEGGEGVLPVNENIDIVEMTSILQFNEIYDYLLNDEHDYEMVVIDSLSSANRMAFLELLESESSKHSRRDRNKAEIQDYVVLQNMFTRIIDGVKELPLHVIFTAHPTSVVHAELGTRYVPVVSPTKMPALALGMFNEIMYLAQDKQGKRFLLMRNYPEYSVECRIRPGITVPNEIENPTMAAYLEAMRGEYVREAENLPDFSSIDERLALVEEDDTDPTKEK